MQRRKILNPFRKRRDELEFLKNFKETKYIEENKELYYICNECNETMTLDYFNKNGNFCVKCGKFTPISAKKRIYNLVDYGSFFEFDSKMKTINHIEFPSYDEKLADLKVKTELEDAVITGVGKICGIKTAISVMDTSFLMGSMGTVVGEKITRLIEYATDKKLPLIIFCASGGARMQEGILSLMQMAKTAGAIERHNQSGQLYISVLTNPTTGGVTASFASLADIILAKPKAKIAFAGPRVIKQTIKQTLPEGFQSSEYMLESGFVDQIVTRNNMKSTLHKLLLLHGYKES